MRKIFNEFWQELRKIKWNITVSRCLYDTSILQDAVKNFDQKYKGCWLIVNAKHTLLPLILRYAGLFFLFLWRTLMFLLKNSIRVQALAVCTSATSTIQSAVTAIHNVSSIISWSHIPLFPIVSLKDTYVQPWKTALEKKLIRKG